MKNASLIRAALAILVCGVLLAAAGCKCCPTGDGNGYGMSRDILNTARSRPELSTFVEAVEAAGLEGALVGEGPFTVFAPTNEAFNKLPAGELERLLMPENKPELTDILTYHILTGRLSEFEAMRTGSETALDGKSLSFGSTIRYTEWPTGWTSPEGSPVLMINRQATVVERDIDCSNGVIQVIDAVLMP
jgi:uncharacterized surface protein with fasciclin (FAS1) repeats